MSLEVIVYILTALAVVVVVLTRLRMRQDSGGAGAVHVGDHPVKDVDGASAAGIAARLLDRAGDHPAHPLRIASLREVLRIAGLPSD